MTKKSFNHIPIGLALNLKLKQAFMPKAAQKLALKYFFTPIEFPTTEEEYMYKQGLPIHRDLVNGKRVTTFMSGNPPFKVLLVHGWSGRASQFMHLGKAMTEAGIDYVSFTAPAHGSSTDDKTHMLEFVTSIEFMAETYGPFDVIVGHSLGGTAAMNAIKNGVGANKVVIIGSHAKISTTIKDFSKKLQLNSKTEKSLIKHLQKNYHKDYERYGIERIASETDIEALIIHDRQDKEAHFSNAEAIHKAFQQSEIYETNGLGHTRILASKEVVNKIIDFIQK